MKKVLLVLLLLGGSIGIGYAAGYFKDRAIRNEALKNAEAAALEVKDYKAAAEVSARDIEARINNESDLQVLIDDLKDTIESISGEKPSVIEIVGWETDIIVIPVDNFFEVEVEKLVPANCVDCVTDFIEDLPPFKFKVAGVTAKLETILGNHFVVGTVTLKDARVLGQEAKIMGTASFKKSLTDILQLETEETKRTLRQRITMTKVSEQFDWSLKYAFQFSRHFSLVAGALDGDQKCLTAYSYDQDESSSLCRGGTIYEYGLSYSF